MSGKNIRNITNSDMHLKAPERFKLLKQFQLKLNIITFMTVAFIAGLMYWTSSVLASCT